jgi:hypothetical protein
VPLEGAKRHFGVTAGKPALAGLLPLTARVARLAGPG